MVWLFLESIDIYIVMLKNENSVGQPDFKAQYTLIKRDALFKCKDALIDQIE